MPNESKPMSVKEIRERVLECRASKTVEQLKTGLRVSGSRFVNLLGRHESALARIAGLEAALRPFAEAGDELNETYPDEWDAPKLFRAKALRAAAEAMK